MPRRRSALDRRPGSDHDELLTTGQAAKLLGTSRQHVVDLCTSGRLGYQMAGVHRRVPRRQVEAIQARSAQLTIDQQKSLWLHRAVAGKLALDPNRVLGKARRNLEHLRQVHRRGRLRADFDEWQSLLDGPLDDLMDLLVSKSPRAVALRQNSPFAGVLSQRERTKTLEVFGRAMRAA